ncbi:GNAT family N-acetyltransferase [Litoreibacter roseus]|uniref:GNAT family acetyltransferase n=1 Tax=Litoreibacter roseus TaxID=2601869 RepID=A0A6N6JEK6_9RHOB|nr:GNAT family N-acetyltransferase [Litoreibacter roseus]GFE64783.1 GNAT family acetyltransferase [Litoreibacter roseus]
MKIRLGNQDDVSQLVDILNEIITIGGTTAYQKPVSASYFDRLLDAPDSKTFLHVAERDGCVAGFQWIEPLDPPDDHIAGIATFAKVSGVQRGIGSALFARTRTACRAAGFTEINATIRGDNTGGLAYYSKMGFEDHSVSANIPLDDGTPVDRIHKRLDLT